MTRKVFVGIKVPVPITNLLQTFTESWLAPEQDIRWSEPSDLHITLKFIGKVPETTIPHLIEKMKGVRCRRFEAEISGAEIFQDAGVLVADIERSEELILLQAGIVKALATAEILLERKDYRPHITVGRWSTLGDIQQIYLEALREQFENYIVRLSTKTFFVDEFILYETVSGHYRILEKFSLRG